MAEERLTFCRICESLCGLRVTVDPDHTDGPRITEILPDKDHATTAGFACQKGLRQHHLYSSPDRLLRPRMKTASGWQDVDWKVATQNIGNQLRAIRNDHGGDAIAMYVGTAAGFSVLHPVFAQGFMDGVGSRNMFASATQDCANKFAVAQRMYGFPFTQPFPDLLRTQCLIIVGANPMVSKWSFLQVPNPRAHINAIKERGGRVIVIDPRLTETAKAAGEHHFIKPGSDVYFYLSFLQELLATGHTDHAVIDTHCDGFEQIAALVQDWTPERSAPLTGISADTLRALVQCYANAQGASLYLSTGVNMGAHGTLAFYLQEIINAVSGNLDRDGGTLVGQGIFDFARFGKKHNLLVKEDRSRIGNFRKTNDAFPGGILADEILTPGKGQIRALIVTGGNPLLTMADSGRLREAFEKLELLITLDIQPTETGMCGHYMLPCTSPLERPDLPFIFPLALGMQTRPYLQATNPVIPPPGEARDEATIYTDIARAARAPLFGSSVFQRLVQWSKRKRPGERYRSVAQVGLLNLLLRLCREPGFKALLGHGWLRAENRGGTLLGKRIYTNEQGTGRVQLADPELLAALRSLASRPEADAEQFSYQLITKRQVQTHNSWTHNYQAFLDRLDGRNYLYINPADAQRENLVEDTLVQVRSEAGAIALPVRLCPELMPGVVAVPHGWGHQHSGQRTAAGSPGVNVNLLASSGVSAVDPISGMSQLTGIPVVLTAISADATAHDWSGLPAAASADS